MQRMSFRVYTEAITAELASTRLWRTLLWAIIRNKVLNACIFSCQNAAKGGTPFRSGFLTPSLVPTERHLLGDSVLKFFQKFFWNAKKPPASQIRKTSGLTYIIQM